MRFIHNASPSRLTHERPIWIKLEPMPNKLVNYGVTENGIAVIELTSDSAGKPLDGPNDRSPNTYTHEMMRDIDEAIVRARFNDDVTCIVLTGNGASFFSGSIYSRC